MAMFFVFSASSTNNLLVFIVLLGFLCPWHISFVSINLWNICEIKCTCRSSHRRCSVKKLYDFAIFTGKHLCWSLFLIKLWPEYLHFVKKRLQHRYQVFSCKCCEIFNNTYFEEHLRWLLLQVHLVSQMFHGLIFCYWFSKNVHWNFFHKWNINQLENFMFSTFLITTFKCL